MPITVNDGGILRTLGAVTVNEGGVIKTLGSVAANDGGVIRGVFSSKKVKVEGITPLVEADDYLVIVSSGAFTLTAPAGARIIIAGGGQGGQRANSSGGKGGNGGRVAVHTLMSELKSASCSLTLGAATNYNGGFSQSTLKIGSKTYSCGNTSQIVQTKWGYIGGNGGNGYYCGSGSHDHPYCSAPNGTGAGGGGGGIDEQYGSIYYGFGGSGGYGNFGGNGDPSYNGEYGSSGSGGAEAPDNSISGTKCGGGGGGGYGAGGGGCSCQESVWYNSIEDCNEYDYSCSFPGEGGAGIIVIEWNN